MPTKSALREASLGNDCASARLFMRQIDAFLKHCVGMDPGTKHRLGCGLFGEASAYFGMVETQGRGTLHMHILIWLEGCPPNAAVIEAILKGPNADRFRGAMQKYADSIVSNQLPIGLSRYSCLQCGSSASDLDVLSIADFMKKDPRNGRRAQQRDCISEPALLRCNGCNLDASSQHILRRVLLQHRPEHWPPWHHILSTGEMNEQAGVECVCRDSKRHASAVVEARESIQADLRDEIQLKDENGLTAVETKHVLESANIPRMKICKSEDDPFQNDDITRLIELLPASKSDSIGKLI